MIVSPYDVIDWCETQDFFRNKSGGQFLWDKCGAKGATLIGGIKFLREHFREFLSEEQRQEFMSDAHRNDGFVAAANTANRIIARERFN